MCVHTPLGVWFGTMIDLKPSPKGLIVGAFTDRNGRECVIQESSVPSESCLWLGVDLGLNGEPIPGGRMHLTRELVLDLLPILRHFARTGSLGYDDPSQQFQIGTWVIGVGPDNKGVFGRVTEVSPGRYLKVQDDTRIPPAGQISCAWDQVDLIWEVTQERQVDDSPTPLERILREDHDDD